MSYSYRHLYLPQYERNIFGNHTLPQILHDTTNYQLVVYDWKKCHLALKNNVTNTEVHIEIYVDDYSSENNDVIRYIPSSPDIRFLMYTIGVANTVQFTLGPYTHLCNLHVHLNKIFNIQQKLFEWYYPTVRIVPYMTDTINLLTAESTLDIVIYTNYTKDTTDIKIRLNSVNWLSSDFSILIIKFGLEYVLALHHTGSYMGPLCVNKNGIFLKGIGNFIDNQPSDLVCLPSSLTHDNINKYMGMWRMFTNHIERHFRLRSEFMNASTD